jgi:hypothetical protein
MKKMFIVLAVLALTVSAAAEVKVYSGSQPWLYAGDANWCGNLPWKGDKYDTTDANIVTVYYDATSEPNRVRAFALNIELSDAFGADNAVIESVSDYFVGECNATEKGYGIFPGTISIDGSGNVTDWGTPVAVNDTPGAVGTGLGTKKIVIEMGSLYTDANAPAKSGILFKFRVNDKACGITISENTERGGIVMENPDEAVDVNMPGAVVICPGDACGRFEGPRDGKCTTPDYTLVLNTWQDVWPTMYDYRADLCGRFDGAPDQKCTTPDYNKILNSWQLSWQ